MPQAALVEQWRCLVVAHEEEEMEEEVRLTEFRRLAEYPLLPLTLFTFQ